MGGFQHLPPAFASLKDDEDNNCPDDDHFDNERVLRQSGVNCVEHLANRVADGGEYQINERNNNERK